MSVRVQGIIDGDRAYFRTWSRSGTVKRLREANGMQVTPCDVLGLCSYGPPLEEGVKRPAPLEISAVSGHNVKEALRAALDKVEADRARAKAAAPALAPAWPV